MIQYGELSGEQSNIDKFIIQTIGLVGHNSLSITV